ncbi:MAG: hypothetical protein AAGB48_11955 [Planctomycetota bacterium]
MARDGLDQIRRTLAHLSRQTIADVTELIVIASEGLAIDQDDEAFARFQSVRVLYADSSTLGALQSEGVRQASAPWVILGEDHAWPEPAYAEAIADRFESGSWVAVGPAMTNANPESIASWSNLLLAYGPWTEPRTGGQVPALPGTNTGYRRETLLALGDRLDDLLAREGGLIGELVRDGGTLYLEPRARTAHQNFSKLSSTISLRVNAGRLYAARRATREKWGFGKRALYAACSPLIPPLRFARILAELRGHSMRLTSKPVVGVGLGVVFDGMGQLLGYVAGDGNAAATLADFEFTRERFLTERDRAQARQVSASGPGSP